MWILIIIILIVVILVAVVKNDNKQIQINHLQNGGFRKSYPLVTKCLEEKYKMNFFDDLGNSFSYSKIVMDVNNKRGTLYIGLKLDMGRDTIVFSTYTNSEGVKYEGQDISTIYTLSEYIIVGIDSSLEKLTKDGILPETNSKVENENNEFNKTNSKDDNKLRDFFIEILKDTDKEDFKTKDTTDILLDALERNEKKIEEKKKKLLNKGEQLDRVTDIDGNIYQTVKIGNQIWMAENLRVSRYRNGDLIPNVTDNEKWGEFEIGAWCNYDNNPNLNSEYGKLYNWYAVDDVRGLAPEGWHTPSNDEWQQLIEYLGGVDGAGGKLKEAGKNHWKEPNEGGTNESCFSALPGGIRYREGAFVDHGYYGHWWSASTNDTSYWYMTFVKATVGSVNGNKYSGFSVRCLRD